MIEFALKRPITIIVIVSGNIVIFDYRHFHDTD